MFGYAGKMLFVNLTNKTLEDRILDEETARNFIGGPGLGAKILYENMPAHADVFGPESMVGFVTSPFNNANVFFGGRYTVVSKSPVTGGWNDANSGGYFGPALKKAGYDAVFINGISETPVYLYIEDGKAQLYDASALWGMTSKALEAKFREIHGEKVQAAFIGPGGERMSPIAAVMNNEHRAAGRGGSGAVIGSKKLKAIVVKGEARTEVADREGLLQLNRELAANMKDGPGAGFSRAFGAYGTGAGFTNSTLSGDAGVKNWSGSGVADYPEAMSTPVGSVGIDKFKKKKYNCSNCPLGCGAIMDIPNDKMDLSDTPRPEYETQGAFGSLLLNSDPISVSQCNELCNEYGLDTISTGSTIAWAMECYNEGVLSREELDGIDLTWGNSDAIVALCEKICKGEGIGATLCQGSREACRRLGKGEEFLVVASGIEEPQHDSRLAYGLSRTYKYDPTPGRHVKGGIGMRPSGPDFDYATSGEADKAGVILSEIRNSAGYCLLGGGASPQGIIPRYLIAVTGFQYTPEEIDDLGVRIFYMRHAFNLREGMSRKSFTLSKRFTEAAPPFTGPLKDSKVDVERLADNFFEIMHMDKETLVPSKEALEAVGGLDLVIADLYR
ncbi:MAG: aldehyde ferredoxin oxidoreductase family protein [Clostridia bacterium]|nr:aldehyde ferredoxin oxidoreductase family protein [Clostridia bacterium]